MGWGGRNRGGQFGRMVFQPSILFEGTDDATRWWWSANYKYNLKNNTIVINATLVFNQTCNDIIWARYG